VALFSVIIHYYRYEHKSDKPYSSLGLVAMPPQIVVAFVVLGVVLFLGSQSETLYCNISQVIFAPVTFHTV